MSTPEKSEVMKWRTALQNELSKHINDLEVNVKYEDVSKAFPGGPHSMTFDCERIDWKELKPWSENLGWVVKSDPETTTHDRKYIPNVCFSRIKRE